MYTFLNLNMLCSKSFKLLKTITVKPGLGSKNNFPNYQNSFQKLFKPVVHRERTNKNLFAIYSCVVAYLAGMESRRARMAICQDI